MNDYQNFVFNVVCSGMQLANAWIWMILLGALSSLSMVHGYVQRARYESVRIIQLDRIHQRVMKDMTNQTSTLTKDPVAGIVETNLHDKSVQPNISIATSTVVEQLNNDTNFHDVMTSHSADDIMSHAVRQTNDNDESDAMLYGSGPLPSSSKIHVKSTVGFQDGIVPAHRISNLHTVETLPIQVNIAEVSSLQPPRVVHWKRVAGEAKTGVAGPENVVSKGKRALETSFATS
ncbi:hypothetical protein ACOSQ4_003230 [Xanthoceras sorbifolium]